MLFFTQCFGAVLDLIHLRFQHNKAKRVFAAAGQLVCVVNPTHNLKVSGWLTFDVPSALVQVLPRGRGRGRWRQGPSHGARALQAKVTPLLRKTVLGTVWVLLPLPGCGCSRDAVVCFPAWQGRLEAASISFPRAVSLGVGGGGGIRSEGVEGSKGRPPPSPKYLWASV